MIIAYHSIFSMYGFWLPNDPRGSGSDYVASWELFRYGPATKTDSRRSVAHLPLPANWQRQAKTALHYPPVSVTGQQALTISRGFAKAAAEGHYRIYACAILPEHVHLVIGASKPRHPPDGRSYPGPCHACLEQQESWDDDRPLWGGHGWNVWLESAEAVERDPLRQRQPAEGRQETSELVVCRSLRGA